MRQFISWERFGRTPGPSLLSAECRSLWHSGLYGAWKPGCSAGVEALPMQLCPKPNPWLSNCKAPPACVVGNSFLRQNSQAFPWLQLPPLLLLLLLPPHENPAAVAPPSPRHQIKGLGTVERWWTTAMQRAIRSTRIHRNHNEAVSTNCIMHHRPFHAFFFKLHIPRCWTPLSCCGKNNDDRPRKKVCGIAEPAHFLIEIDRCAGG